ncbi:MAG: T9SS type A sorting domain-containing protein [candidate division Zixibacteria bacterium]|nr:T9SS type A sorting domain-containing protein [candidate division Zixibacteria bacterium]
MNMRVLMAGVMLMLGATSAWAQADSIPFTNAVSYAVGNYPHGMYIGNFTEDAYPDIVTACGDSVILLKNYGDGTFMPALYFYCGPGSHKVTAADIDSDGDLDLAVACAAGNYVAILTNDGSGNFTKSAQYNTGNSIWISFADFNDDNVVDLAVALYYADSVSFYRNDGSGIFAFDSQYATGSRPVCIATGDFDTDGFSDLAVANDLSGTITVLLNDSIGHFGESQEVQVGRTNTVCAQDVDKDGDCDLVFTNTYGNRIGILFNDGAGMFIDTTYYDTGFNDPQDVFAADFNGDNLIDLAVANFGANYISILRNQGDGTYRAPISYSGLARPRSVFAADLDNDGDNELAATDIGAASVVVFINQSQAGYESKLIIPRVTTCNPANAPAGIAVRVYAQSTDSICGITVPLTWTETWNLDSVSRVEAATEMWETWAAVIDNIGDSVKFGGVRILAQAIPPGDSQLIATLYFHPTIPVGITDSLLLVIDTFTTAPQSALAFADCESHTYVPEVLFDTSVFYGYMAGDANGDGVVNIGDCVYIINYVFRAGLAPVPLNAGDPNGDCNINIGDAVYLVNWIFRGGPPPICGCVTGPATCCQGNDARDVVYKSASVSVSTIYDGNTTELIIQSPVDIYGLQIEVRGDNGAAVANNIGQTQLYHQWNNGTATIGIMDINGVGRIPAGETSVLTIAGEATVTSALGADINGRTFEIAIGEAAKAEALPSRFALHQNRPNPFNPATEISFTLPKAAKVTLEVYNITGQRISTLVNGHLEAGYHSAIWDGKDEAGQTVSSGIYFYRITAGEFSETRKMVLLK